MSHDARETLISIRKVTKRFPGVVALDGISLDIASGELHAIVGENGAGKSTLVKILSGVLTDYEGRIQIQGRDVRFTGTRDAEARGIGIIHQELNLVEELSAAANIFLGREIRRLPGVLDRPKMEIASRQLFQQLECDVDPRQRAGSLRVGDQQLVEIARAISLDHDILIMDEPTSALTESEVARLDRVIGRLRSRGVTILYISHKMDEIFRLADRITVLRDGKLVETRRREQTSPTEVTHLMVGREIESCNFSSRLSSKPEAPVLRVRDLSLPWPDHPRQWRLERVSFEVYRGEIVGIAGLMGAGRTELLECLFGASKVPPHPSAIIELDGIRVQFGRPSKALHAGMALVTEDRKSLGLFGQLSVEKNATICSLREVALAGVLQPRRERRAALRLFRDLSVRTASCETPIDSLSGGNQQKCLIGRWLLTRPKVLLLDDPTRGVDVGAKAELYQLMDRLCRDGLGILLTSSELPELLSICDRILVLCEGRLTGQFSRNEATEERIIQAATQRRSQVR